MTTIIGLKSNSGIDGIVLASDTQLSYSDKTGKFSEKKPMYKIVHGKDWAMAFCGIISNELYRFFQILRGQKKYGSSEEMANEIITRAVTNYERWKENPKLEDIHFKEVNSLNTILKRNEAIDLEDLNNFILAINTESKGPVLFEVDEFGNLKEAPKNKEIEYITIGTGEEIVERYVEETMEKEDVSPFILNIPIAIDLARKSLVKAQRDPYTGSSIDLMILTKPGIETTGKELRNVLTEAEEKFFSELKDRYSQILSQETKVTSEQQ